MKKLILILVLSFPALLVRAQVNTLVNIGSPIRGIAYQTQSGTGDLFVSLYTGNTVRRINPNTGATVATLTSSPAFNAPHGIAFDAAGNMYVVNENGNSIYRFNAPIPNTTQTLVPNFTYSGGSLSSPDGKGKLK